MKRRIKDQLFLFGLSATALAFVLALPILTYTSKDVVQSTLIKDKERVVKQDESYYLVYTDRGVYKNSDSFLYLKFDSSDVYNTLEPGMTCDMSVYWFRVPFFSMYQNIVSVDNCMKESE